ncbi:MAG: alanine--tRNA ligase-related protein, partial [Planctomycetota bacterium]
LVSVLQDKRSNYDTDVFNPYFVAIEEATGARPYRGKLGAEDADGVDTAYRVIADHIRTLTLAITDGATPSNESRGYVLRRVLRRAVRFGRQKLNAKTGFFAKLVPIVVESLGDAFPEVRKHAARVQGIILDEEESFGRTLDRGIKLFDEVCNSAANTLYARANHIKGPDHVEGFGLFVKEDLIRQGLIPQSSSHAQEWPISSVDWRRTPAGFPRPLITGADAFQLYDTYGFPLDLTQLMAEERGLTVDVAGFEKEMEAQRERSRAGAKDGEKRLELTTEAVETLKTTFNVKPTDDSHKFEAGDRTATIKAIWDGRTFDDHTDPNETGLGRVGIVLDKTNFYSEMGGQVGDHGRIGDRAHKAEFRVEDVRSFGGYVLHIGRLAKGQFKVGETVQLHLDRKRRERVQANHTATHLMNFALRRVLGEGADQKGSLVAPERLRFDFDAAKPVSPEQLGQAEQIVREFIASDERVYAEEAPLFVAKQISGLRAVFGEVYPDPVRVVSVGAPIAALTDAPEDPNWAQISIEFCGGTHVAKTSDIGAFAITQEEAVAKGIRRVVAVTGAEAEAAIRAAETVQSRISAATELPAAALPAEAAEIAGELDALTMPASAKAQLRSALGGLQERVKAAEKAAAGERRAAAEASARRIAEDAKGAADTIVVRDIDCGSDRAALQAALKIVQAACPTAAVMLLSVDQAAGSVAVIAGVPKPVVAHGLEAGDWVRATAQVLGGKGGGKPEQAQGGGSEIAKLGEAIDTARQFGLRAIT